MDQLFAVHYAYLIPLLPLAGAIIAGFFGAKLLRGQSHWPIWLGVGASAAISLSLLVQMVIMWHAGKPDLVSGKPDLFISHDWFTWIQAGTFKATAGFYFDALSAVMLSVVTGIGLLIMIFSAGYMKGEAGYFRFFAYLGLFIFAMTCLVMGNNFIMLYLGWEGVGLCSYLLIGYYYERPSAREAAKKAFLVNRVGDFGFGLGIILIWQTFGTVSFFGDPTQGGVLQMAAGSLTAAQQSAMHWIPFLLMLGAFGKSAQFPLYVWLPDAMEGPTPVSALIHAATMVTAGVYMIARCSTLFFSDPAAMMTIASIGAFTALFAATIALRQMDLKKVFAYSTVSQLGYMFVGVAVLAPVAGIFHLVTHAFFKALLFLSSGVVMHAMAGELDMRKMSGLKRILPWTNIFILVGCLALAGVPGFSGFFSKDEIIGAALKQGHYVLVAVLLLAAFMTAYYTFRLYFRVFQGPLEVPPPPAVDYRNMPDYADDAEAQHEAAVQGGHGHDARGHDAHAHDARVHGGSHGGHSHEPFLMIFPLAILTIGAFLAGYLNFPQSHLGEFLGTSPSFTGVFKLAGSSQTAEMMGQAPAEAHEWPIMICSGAIAIAGILVAWYFHLKNRARATALAQSMPGIVRILDGKFYIDEIYQELIVQPLRRAGETFYAVDRFIIDGLVAIIGYFPQLSGFALKLSIQRGYLQGYAATMLLGIAAILLLIFAGS